MGLYPGIGLEPRAVSLRHPVERINICAPKSNWSCSISGGRNLRVAAGALADEMLAKRRAFDLFALADRLRWSLGQTVRGKCAELWPGQCPSAFLPHVESREWGVTLPQRGTS